MSQPLFMDNPDYLAYVRLLHRLHEMKIGGIDQTDEADEVRDLMDAPWYRMSQEEMNRVEALSADLYTLSDPDRQSSTSQDEANWTERGRDAGSRGDYEGLLALIRHDPGPMSPADLAFARARWWFQLGDPQSALLFAEEAARLDPSRWNIVVLRSHLLQKLGREEAGIDSMLRFAEAYPNQVPDQHRASFLRAAKDSEQVQVGIRDYVRHVVEESPVLAA